MDKRRRRGPVFRPMKRLWPIALLAACSSDPEPVLPADSGATPAADAAEQDAGFATDAGFAPDAEEQTDAGPVEPPPQLVRYLTGDPSDAVVTPLGPALILMGGGRDVDEAFDWWRNLIASGDVVVLRTSGADGYNDYLYREIGGANSVETLLVTSRELAADDYVVQKIREAEAIFLAGGDQSTYLRNWKDSPLEDAVREAHAGGAVLGGTSAGLAVLGEYIYAAYDGSVTSAEALADPFHEALDLETEFFKAPLLGGVITDSHFATRDRMGRLLAFLCRIHSDYRAGASGIGIEENTAIVIGSEGRGIVMGTGGVYLVRAPMPPGRCSSGVPLSYENLELHLLRPGDALDFPALTTDVPAVTISARDGVLEPADPY